MKAGRFINGWTATAAVLAVVIIAGGVYMGLAYQPGHAVEIALPPERPLVGTVYISGRVNNPGGYPVYAGDSVDDLVRAAGGFTAEADPGDVELIIGGQGEVAESQKIDINTAESWLLAALPGIGEVRARAIVDYRRQHGPFRDTREIMKVAGLGEATFELIQDLITVGN
jgi:competence protein ComEA